MHDDGKHRRHWRRPWSGYVLAILSLVTLTFKLLIYSGPNAVRVLQAVGVLDEVLKKINPAELKTRGFVFYYGVGEHEKILAVSLPYLMRAPASSLLSTSL